MFLFWGICWLFFNIQSCLHSLHVIGWFSYVVALYMFVTHFERCIWVFRFISAVCTCLHQLHILGWFPYIFLLYTFVTFERYILFCSTFDHKVSCLHLTISLLCLHSVTPLQCNEMSPTRNLLSFCALYAFKCDLDLSTYLNECLEWTTVPNYFEIHA